MDRKDLRRRDFLRLSTLTAAGFLVSSCAAPSAGPAPAAPTAAGAAPAPTAAPKAPTTAPAAAPTATAAAKPAATTAPAAAAAAGAPPANTTATISILDFGGEADKKIYSDAHVRFKK